MKKVLLFAAVAATVSFAACTGNKQAEAEKAKADSLAAVAKADSIAKVQADSLAALTPDTIVVEETVEVK